MSHPGHCFICEGSLANGAVTRIMKQRDIKTLINKSKERGDNNWKYLEKLTEVEIHDPCRVAYSAMKTVKSAKIVDPEPQVQFNFRGHCFLCKGKCGPENKKPFRNVATEKLQRTIEEIIDDHPNDEWPLEVQARINSTSLMEVEARYHTTCFAKFSRICDNHVIGRPKVPELEAAFLQVCRYMEESDNSQFSLRELMDKMDVEMDTETFKRKLRNKYNTDIIILVHPGKATIICFRNTGYRILRDSWYQRKASTEEDERLRVVSAAADIIREDIRSKVYDTSIYPPPGELLNDVEDDIPESFRVFLDKVLIKGEKNTENKLTTKQDSIAHAIISIVRPRSFIPSIGPMQIQEVANFSTWRI